MAPLTLFEEPAPPPLIVGPVSLMRLVEIEDIATLHQAMEDHNLNPVDFTVETKWNGWIVQSAGGRLYTRRGKEITANFPEIADFVSPYTTEHLAGELVYWSPDGIMEEPNVTRVAGTKDPREAIAKLESLPGHFEYILFDIIAARGYDISRLSTEERRDILLETVDPQGPIRISPIYPYDQWEKVYREGVSRGGDGAVFKNIHASYVWRPVGQTEARPVGVWYKLKPELTDDFVVYGSSFGKKGKLLIHFGQYHKGELIEVGAVNNFSEETEKEMKTLLAKGLFVVEIGFTSRYSDPPGRLQDPRFLRVREEKEPEDAVLPEKYAP